MSNFDVIVVGAGPAGSTAAYVLARAGMRVALVDKAAFPRDKLCGGLLSGRTEKVYKGIFGEGWQDLHEFTSMGARFFYRARLLNEVDGCRKMCFTRRGPFDHYLVQMATRKGATLLENVRAVSVERETSSVWTADGTALRGDFIIGADGAFSRTAQNLGLSLRKDNLALGLEIDYPRQGGMADLAKPEIYFGIVRWGYGWVFPKKDSLTIGIAGLANKNSSLRNGFQAFLKQVCHHVPDIRWRGHPIPFCNFKLRPGIGNILLAGDAAGFVEPVTGEGIAFAMESASHAAHAVLDAAGCGDPRSAFKHYQRRCEKLAQFLTQAERMRHLVFSAISERLFAKAIERSKSVIYGYMDLAWDEMDYGDYFNFLVKKLWNHWIPSG
jgi:geranylgeranyl reductase family protein